MPSDLVSAAIRRGLFTRTVGKRLVFFQEVSSTMDEAARLAREGAADGTVVVAETQTAGRGRFGRNWVSPGGNIYMSVVFRPSLDALPFLSLLAGVATVQTIRKTTGLSPKIKWPNDVMLDGKKVSGNLVESVMVGEAVCYAVLGIGLNVALDPSQSEETAGIATSLEAAAGNPLMREEILRQLLQDLDSLYLKLCQGQTPLEPWRAMLETLGQRVQVTWRNDIYSGLAEGIDPLGNLQLRLEDGRLLTMTAGDVTLRTD
ncbi:MAG: biotin--[acetyl-CoA-carboxylase] ligase [Chloroflexi bacterium]|nr:biotin--[acetyl-CoA-carboxylase] ligase [Chloroflexota bacterium]